MVSHGILDSSNGRLPKELPPHGSGGPVTTMGQGAGVLDLHASKDTGLDRTVPDQIVSDQVVSDSPLNVKSTDNRREPNRATSEIVTRTTLYKSMVEGYNG